MICIPFPHQGSAIDVESLYRRYGPMVLRRCRALLHDEEQARDAMQDVFVQLLRKRNQLHGQYPSSLLYRMATNHCLNILRREKRHVRMSDDQFSARLPAAEAPEQQVVDRDLLQSLLSGERESTRRIAVLRHLEGLSLQETASRIGMSVSGVRKRLDGLRRRSLALMSA